MRQDQNVFITGGNKGIGLEVTKRFLEAGYQVIVAARDFANFPYNNHPDIKTIEYNLENTEGIPELISQLPGIDILINNAGVLFALPWDNYPQKKIDQMLKINIESPVALINAVAGYMLSKGKGRIVSNASIAGEIGHPDIWYGITKAGIINLTKSYAKLLGPKGVVINAVAAGPVETEMLGTIPEARKKEIKRAVYTGRFALPEEVADTIFWLATESPEYINGTCIDINNGAFPR